MSEVVNGNHMEGEEEVFGFKVSDPNSSQEEREDEDNVVCKLTNGFHHCQVEEGGGGAEKWPDPRITNGGNLSSMDEDSPNNEPGAGREVGRRPFQYSALDEASSSDASPVVHRREYIGEGGVAEVELEREEGQRSELPGGEGEGCSQTESLSSVEITSDGRSSSRYSSRHQLDTPDRLMAVSSASSLETAPLLDMEGEEEEGEGEGEGGVGGMQLVTSDLPVEAPPTSGGNIATMTDSSAIPVPTLLDSGEELRAFDSSQSSLDDYVHLSTVITGIPQEREPQANSQEGQLTEDPATPTVKTAPAEPLTPRGEPAYSDQQEDLPDGASLSVSAKTQRSPSPGSSETANENSEDISGHMTQGNGETATRTTVAGSSDLTSEKVTSRESSQLKDADSESPPTSDATSVAPESSPSQTVTSFSPRPPSIQEEEEEGEGRGEGDEERTITAVSAARLKKAHQRAGSQERVLLASVEVTPHFTPSPMSTPEHTLSPERNIGQSNLDSTNRRGESQGSQQRTLSPGGSSDLDFTNLDGQGRRQVHVLAHQPPTSPPGAQQSAVGSTSDLPVLEPLSPAHSRSELNQQYDYLRRTLSHSRRRYSTRRRVPPSSSSDRGSPAPGLVSRHTMRDGGGRYREDRNSRIRDMLTSTEIPRSNSVLERHIDQHGRAYFMNHNTRTVAYGRNDLEASTEVARDPQMRARREMLDRRYRSLQRSFRGGPRSNGSRPVAAPRRFGRGRSPEVLTPIVASDNLSLSLTAAEAEIVARQVASGGSAAATPGAPPKPKRQSGKSPRWNIFSRKSSRQVSQTADTSQTNDDILPVTSPMSPGASLDNEEWVFRSSFDRTEQDEAPPSFSRAERGRSGSVSGVSTSGQSESRSGSDRGVSEGPMDVEEGGVESPRMVQSPVILETDRQTQSSREGTPGSDIVRDHPVNEGERQVEVEVEREEEVERQEEGEGEGVREEVTVGVAATAAEGSQERGLSPTIAEMGRQQSIVRASRITDADRAAAQKARRRARAGTMDSPAPRRSQGDTDDDTNAGLMSGRRSTVLESSATPERLDEEVDVAQRSVRKMKEKEKEGVEETPVKKKSTRRRRMTAGLKHSPALRFVTRQDLYSFLSSAGEAGEEFFANRSMMELVQRIRSDSNLFEKYQHSRQLVNALNRFADPYADLPEGWEKKLNQEGKVFFIDHSSRLTSFIDPRLPLPNQQLTYTQNELSLPPARKVQSLDDEPSVRSHHQTTVTQTIHTTPSPPPSDQPATPVAYEDQVVAFFSQTDVAVQIAQRYQRGVRPQLRDMIEDIRLNATPALERIQMSGSMAAYELALVLSLFEEEIGNMRPRPPQPLQPPTPVPPPMPLEASGKPYSQSTLQRKKEAFSSKLQNFKVMMARLGFAQSSRLKFNIRRDHMLEDAYEHMMKSELRHLQRKRLNISFRGEEGLDYGGPSREFFFLLSREIFNPYYGLFEYSANDTYTVQISPTSAFILNNLEWFMFAGRVIALVIAQGFLLDVFFTRSVYKSLLGRPPSLKDLESLEPAFYNSLVWMQENDPEPLDLTFTVEEEAFGQLTAHELKPGGDDILVTEENKHEYIDLMTRWRLDRGVAEQMGSLRKGFSEVVPVTLLQGFDAQELEFLTAGTLEIDVDDWRNNTEYRNGYHPTHPVVLWFWQAVETFDNEQRLRLLQFVTGTSSVPFEGFKALRGSNGPKKFTIDYFNDVKSLPRTHTCFNRVDLPPYSCFETLFEKLRFAVEEGSTFGIE